MDKEYPQGVKDHTVFFAAQGALSAWGSPDEGWYWDYAGADEPNPHGPFQSYEDALNDKSETLRQAALGDNNHPF